MVTCCSSSSLPLSPADDSRSSKSDGGHETEDKHITGKDQERGGPSAEGPQRTQGKVMEGQEGFLEEVAFELIYNRWEALNILRAGGICIRISGKEGVMKACKGGWL